MIDQKQTCQQQLEDLRKEYDEFAYIVSHDLRAPLRAISNLSTWIREDIGENLDPDIQNNLQLLQKRTERMESMISGLLDFSRISKSDLDVREISVQEMVQHVAASFDQNRPLVLHLSVLPTFTTYSKKLEKVFHHLLQNAISFNEKESPEVWIDATELEEAYHFKVKDNGIGIGADAQEKIFNLFYTVQPKDQLETQGVGLTIARKIVQFVGGAIWVHSVPGQGSEFTFSWPKTV